MSTTTPKRQTTSTGLKSTPQSAGSAARSKELTTTNFQVPAVRTWIERDLENAEICDVDLMLKSFILDCMVDESSTMEQANTLFETCLDRVLPICNSPDVNEQLKDYSKVTGEAGLYGHFVNAANTALSRLEDLDELDNLRKPSDRLVFEAFGMEIRQFYQGVESNRKPDVVLISADDVPGGVEDGRFMGTVKRSPNSLGWREVRTVIEFKATKKRMKEPLSTYTNEGHIPSRNYLSPKPLVNGSAIQTLSQGEPEASSNDCGSNMGGSGIPDNTTTQKRKATPSESQRDPLLKAGGWPNEGSGSSSKRQRIEHSDTNARKPVATQTGTYGAEMFASHLGRQHVICLSITGDVLYIWRYDRQGAIQSTPLNFIQDLPRFLVLLLAMQRFQDRHWGLNPVIDPRFGTHSADSEMAEMAVIEDEEQGEVDLVFDWSSEKRSGHYGLVGRATNVIPVKSQKFQSKKLVAKVFWAEVSRTSEPDILKKVYEIAEKEPDVQNHVPVMVFHHRFSNSSTAAIRLRLGLPTKGARVLFLILFEELMKITKLTGEPFLQCWWETVKCHLALWKNGVHHRDISASNLMYKDGEGHPVGILNDFDLATTAQAPTGNERTGTIPFMAVELLTEEGLAGEIEHVYAHDAESFIWVILWVCARYEQGVLLPNPPLNLWLTVDAITCRMAKVDYLLRRKNAKLKITDIKPAGGHEKNWFVVERCLDVLKTRDPLANTPSDETCDASFQVLLAGPFTAQRRPDEEEVSGEGKNGETTFLE